MLLNTTLCFHYCHTDGWYWPGKGNWHHTLCIGQQQVTCASERVTSLRSSDLVQGQLQSADCAWVLLHPLCLLGMRFQILRVLLLLTCFLLGVGGRWCAGLWPWQGGHQGDQQVVRITPSSVGTHRNNLITRMRDCEWPGVVRYHKQTVGHTQAEYASKSSTGHRACDGSQHHETADRHCRTREAHRRTCEASPREAGKLRHCGRLDENGRASHAYWRKIATGVVRVHVCRVVVGCKYAVRNAWPVLKPDEVVESISRKRRNGRPRLNDERSGSRDVFPSARRVGAI